MRSPGAWASQIRLRRGWRYKSEARIDHYAAGKSTDGMRSGSAPPLNRCRLGSSRCASRCRRPPCVHRPLALSSLHRLSPTHLASQAVLPAVRDVHDYGVAGWREPLAARSAQHLAIGSTLLPLVIGYAYVVVKCTEFRTAEVRDWAMRVFLKGGKSVAKTAA
jgi:hypothetical protein